MGIRDESLRRIASGRPVEVLVIGGGVNGVAVLRELALNGVPALLVDKGDFCAGASGASSRMAHGGLRYLENREFKLVAEATRERNLLLKHACHVARPLEVAVPLTAYVRGLAGSIGRFLGLKVGSGGLSAAALEGALRLYELLGRVERSLPSHSIAFGRDKFPPALSRRYKALVTYFDGRISNPEGLVLEMIEDSLASSDTAACLNHVDWTLEADGTVRIVDPVSAGSFALRPKLVVNATGAWIDRVNQSLGLPSAYIRPVKGAHVLLRHEALRERLAGRAFYFDDGTGRMVICYPLDRTVLLGTTEILVRDPDDAEIAASEVSYLTQAISSLFEDITVTPEHVVALTTGIRPLQSGGGGSVTQANRDHLIAEDRLPADGRPVLSLVGGKWTTFRAFGEQAADRILEVLGVARTCSTRRRAYPGAAVHAGLAPEIAARTGLHADRAAVLVARYGAIAAEVAGHCAAGPDRPLASLPNYSAREIGWLIAQRAVVRLDDLLLRRTQVVLDGLATEAVLRECAGLLAAELGRDATWREAEVERCMALPTVMAGAAPRPATQEAVHA